LKSKDDPAARSPDHGKERSTSFGYGRNIVLF
jgi:hypothetical protein